MSDIHLKEDSISVSQARDILGYADSHTVLRMARRGLLTMWRPPGGRKYLLSRREVEDLAMEMQRQAEEERRLRRLERQMFLDI